MRYFIIKLVYYICLAGELLVYFVYLTCIYIWWCLIETTVMECRFNFILPLFLLIDSIVGVGMLSGTICPFTDRKFLPLMLKPVTTQYDLCIAVPMM